MPTKYKRRGLWAAGLIALTCASEVNAGSFTQAFSNDRFAQSKDKWVSNTWFGHYRFDDSHNTSIRMRNAMFTPYYIGTSDPGKIDRPAAGLIGFGISQQRDLKFSNFKANYGLELIVLGDQNGMLDLQEKFHDTFSMSKMSKTVRDSEVPDHTYLAATGGFERQGHIGPVHYQNFGEVGIGFQDYARLGGALVLGAEAGANLVRDPATGLAIPAGGNFNDGLTLIASADHSHFWEDALYTPGYVFEPNRTRASLAVKYRRGFGSFLYGLSWVSNSTSKNSPADVPHENGQLIGTLGMNLSF